MATPRLRLCLLWHMHQPIYRDPGTGEFILPWVRLHATRAYYDMPKVLGEFEGARAVVNLVPSLLWQLDQYVKGTARDHFLDLTRKPAGDLTPDERAFVVRNFFMVDWETCVKVMPRYWEILHKRGRDLRAVELTRAAAALSDGEVRDLQVLFNLAWMGFRAEEEEECVRALKKKGRDYTEQDKEALLATQQKILSQVMPALAQVWKAGQAELTVTPFYHPILPLLIDSDSARRAMPNATLPPRFSWPEDARTQVRRALDYAEQNLGARPQGMWPAEGSVSPEALALLAQEGVKWAATDEGNFLRSKPARDRRGLYRPYQVRAGDRELSMIFRDRGLSDLIGFTYSKSPAKAALDDLFGHLNTIASSAPRGEIPLVTIALDGENAWEHYPNSGREFLRGLYERLSKHEHGIEPVNAGEFLAKHPPTERIEEIHSGSWIESNYRIWIGHEEDNSGWTQLGEARKAIAEKEKAQSATPEQLQAAKDALYVAEGSDWFWWYGDDFSTESLAEFDALFRGYVKAAWRALGELPPAKLDEPISQKARPAEAFPTHEPQGFIRPRLDGRIASYFDWTGAGLYRPGQARGSMFRGEGVFSALHFGFDEQQLYLRLDPSQPVVAGAEPGTDLRIHLVTAGHRTETRIALKQGTPAPEIVSAGSSEEGKPPPAGVGLGPAGQATFHDIFEIALPFAAMGLTSGMRLALAVQVMREGVEVERLPRYGYLSFTVPDADFELKNWKV